MRRFPSFAVLRRSALAGFLSKGVASSKGDFRHLSKEELSEFREIFSLVDKVRYVLREALFLD